MFDHEGNAGKIRRVEEMKIAELARHQKEASIVGLILIASLLGAAATFWFDLPKISFLFSCAAFYFAVWTICGSIAHLQSAIVFTLEAAIPKQTNQLNEIITSERKQ